MRPNMGLMSLEGGLNKTRHIDVILMSETTLTYSTNLALIKILNPLCNDFKCEFR